MQDENTATPIWSPHDINLILHLYTTSEPWPYGESMAYLATMKRFVEYGLVDRADFPKVTPRGEAFIDLLCSTPVPIRLFGDPRTGNIIPGRSVLSSMEKERGDG